ncbi:MAG: DUF308 domain-containing protein [Spirochaetales bacterium]
MRKSIIGTSILIFSIGLIMIISPETCVIVSVIILGIAGIVNGFYNIFSVRNLLTDAYFKRIIFIRGLSSILIGLLAILLPVFVAQAIWYILIYMLAIYLLISAVMEIMGVLQLKKAGLETNTFTIEIIGSILLAIILFIVPATIGLFVIRIIGAIAIALSISLFIWEWRSKPNMYVADVAVEDVSDEKQ